MDPVTALSVHLAVSIHIWQLVGCDMAAKYRDHGYWYVSDRDNELRLLRRGYKASN